MSNPNAEGLDDSPLVTAAEVICLGWFLRSTDPDGSVDASVPKRASASASQVSKREGVPVASSSLATYLNDHLAGSTGALALLAHLAHREPNAVIASELMVLHADVAADRRELERLMATLQIAVRRPRRVLAWAVEKMGEVKLRVGDRSDGSLRLLEGLEAVAIGVEGKLALWQALAAASVNPPPPDAIDYGQLIERARQQRQRVEVVRLRAAKQALSGTRQQDAPPT